MQRACTTLIVVNMFYLFIRFLRLSYLAQAIGFTVLSSASQSTCHSLAEAFYIHIRHLLISHSPPPLLFGAIIGISSPLTFCLALFFYLCLFIPINSRAHASSPPVLLIVVFVVVLYLLAVFMLGKFYMKS